MKCPLSSFYRSWPSGEIALKKEDCLKEECAWWSDADKCCAILRISASIDLFRQQLKNIDVILPRK